MCLESLEKQIAVPSLLHKHLCWWLQEENILAGQSLHPLQHAWQIFTDTSDIGWAAHLGDFTARGLWSFSRKQTPHNYIPRRKSGIYWIQVRRAAAAAEISLWTR